MQDKTFYGVIDWESELEQSPTLIIGHDTRAIKWHAVREIAASRLFADEADDDTPDEDSTEAELDEWLSNQDAGSLHFPEGEDLVDLRPEQPMWVIGRTEGNILGTRKKGKR